MTQPLNFQDMILALHAFWAEQGCLIWHPYYSQIGAGTMNPATFLRVLGPEPFNVAYVEPSVRPDDGRYGENPNRLQTFYQYQVILKPDPGNPQELYLDSLQAIGIDPARHDIRFVEDNWESPALGAWGLGWEVWLDGLEITQFTYFQQTGQLDLDPVSVEITYGLDRIAAPLQGANSFANIQWSAQRTFGDMNLQAEQEQSRYYFEVADVDRNRQLYELHAAEVRAALAAELALPAYDHLLRLSHIFNVLDTRGAIGVTERAAFFKDMRGMARDVAKLYLDGRERLEFPWLDESAAAEAKASQGQAAPVEIAVPAKAADVLLEIGAEELPPADLEGYLAQLRANAPALFDNLHLEHGDVRVYGTPRRLVLHVEDVAARQADREELVKGPPAGRAFGADGTPTQAAEGFAKGKGIDVKTLDVMEIDGGQYAVARVFEPGRNAIEVLAEALPDFIAGLKAERAIRWNASNVSFSRPLRWLAALFGEHVIPFDYAGLRAGRASRGLRFSDPAAVEVRDAAAYFKHIDKQGILLDVDERRETIRGQVAALAKKAGGTIPVDEALLAEVTHLVERPTAVLCKFDESFLALPREVLVAVLRKHQRCFPVEQDGELLPVFIAVRNGGEAHLDEVAKGNEAVVRARFADAAFFVDKDRRTKLEDFVPQLAALTFQQKLGSMLDKTERLEALVAGLAKLLPVDQDELKTAQRAARLAKADLATNMVVEMTSLQGVMGAKYALDAGEPPEVAEAIREHYLPASAGDRAPHTKAGLLLGIADRLDSLAGLFAAGLAPTGSKDPFALRRAALGLIHNLIAWELDFDLRAGLEAAAHRLPIEANAAHIDEALAFIVGRLRVHLTEAGHAYDAVDALLAAQGRNPHGAAKAVEVLVEFTKRDDWTHILDTYARCVRITRGQTLPERVDGKALVEDAERALLKALEAAEQVKRAPGSVDDFFAVFLPLMPAIERFFDDVLVMAEDDKLRAARLGLLGRIAALAEGVAHLEKLEGF